MQIGGFYYLLPYVTSTGGIFLVYYLYQVYNTPPQIDSAIFMGSNMLTAFEM